MHALDLFKLDQKTAIVTGGARGLGAQIAKGLAEAGANIVICSRKLAACEEMSHELNELGVDDLAFESDVTNTVDLKKVVSETQVHVESIDNLVHYSGSTWVGI